MMIKNTGLCSSNSYNDHYYICINGCDTVTTSNIEKYKSSTLDILGKFVIVGKDIESKFIKDSERVSTDDDVLYIPKLTLSDRPDLYFIIDYVTEEMT